MLPIFRSFLPLHNPIGFGAVDLIEVEIAALLLLAIFAYARLGNWPRRFAERTAWCMLSLALLPIALRLAMLGAAPVPVPNGSDEFSHLLAADTLRHFRLANPPHPMHRFFETTFVLQQPSYSSIFPVGQGMVLAFGRLISGSAWTGVLISVALLCALTYWMLRAWTTPGWAAVGGLLAVMEFGPLRYWMNTYWGGAVSAIAGCLVFGSLPRLRAGWRSRDAALMGLGFGIQILTRPFESVLMAIAIAIYLAPALRRSDLQTLARTAAIAGLCIAPAIGIVLLQNKQVTGSWTTLPYVLSRYQYGVPTTFTFQPPPEPHGELTPGQRLDYQEQSATHGSGTDTFTAYFARLAQRARFYRFFFLPPLYLALPFFLPALRQWRYLWVGLTLAIFALGTNFYPYFYPHYIAAAACLFVLVSVAGLDRLSRIVVRGLPAGRDAAILVTALCAAQFLFWYGFHFFGDSNASLAMLRYDAWDDVNHGDPEGRIAVRDKLAQSPGRQLVFVRYWPQHRFTEWVQNEADIDRARVVWALDRGNAEDELLRQYYPGRIAWLLEPDAHLPNLSPYQPEPPPPPEPPREPREKPSPEQNGIQLLPVP